MVDRFTDSLAFLCCVFIAHTTVLQSRKLRITSVISTRSLIPRQALEKKLPPAQGSHHGQYAEELIHLFANNPFLSSFPY